MHLDAVLTLLFYETIDQKQQQQLSCLYNIASLCIHECLNGYKKGKSRIIYNANKYLRVYDRVLFVTMQVLYDYDNLLYKSCYGLLFI